MKKETKKELVDFLSENLINTKTKKHVKKTELNKLDKENLSEMIKKYGLEERFKKFLDAPEIITFLVEGTDKNGKTFTYDGCQAVSKVEMIRHFKEKENVTVTKIVTAKGHHICKYCGSITEGQNKDMLCEECHELFGHSKYSEL